MTGSAKRITWSAVGGWFFLLMGGLVTIAAAGAGCYFVALLPAHGMTVSPRMAGAILWGIVGGVIWIKSGIAFFRGNLKLAIPGAIAGWILGGLGHYLLKGLLPGG